MPINDDLAEEFINYRVDLLRAGEGVAVVAVSNLRQLEAALVDLIADNDPSSPGRTTYQLRRLNTLLTQTRRTIRSTYTTARRQVTKELIELADLEQRQVVRIINGVFDTRVASVALSPNDLKQLATESMTRGNPASEWWDDQSVRLRRRFEAEMRMGVTQGETVDQLVARVRGKATGRRVPIQLPSGESRVVREYVGGIMDASRREAVALVRTAVQTNANRVINETYKANGDLVYAVAALVTLDTRTSPTCIARSGGVWLIDTGEPTEDSGAQEPFPGEPPWHWNCRTVLVPVTKSWDQLIAEAGGEPTGVLGNIPPSKRASMDGFVPGRLNYEQWLKKQTTARQLDVLGPGRYRLWKQGKITLAQLTDQSGRPLTVAELRRRYDKP